MIDVKVHEIDPAWPISEAALAGRDRITAAGPLPAAGTTTIHVNPRFVGGPPSVGFIVLLLRPGSIVARGARCSL